MNTLKANIFRFRYWLFALLSWFAFLLLLNDPSFNQKDLNELQNRFQNKEDALEKHLTIWSQERLDFRIKSDQKEFFDFIYRGDSLIFWSNNTLPIERYATIQFPVNGVVRLQNGWYYVKTLENNGFTYCSAFLLSQTFNIDNEFLQTKFNSSLSQFNLNISLNPEEGQAIENKYGKAIFFVQEINQKNDSSLKDQWVLLSFICGLFFLIFAIYQSIKHQPLYVWLLLISLFSGRLLSLDVNWTKIFGEREFLQVELFAYNSWFSSFFDFCLNLILVAFVALLLFRNLMAVQRKWMLWSVTILLFPLWWFVITTTEMIVIHSKIPLDLSNIFSLNFYALLVILLFGLLFFTYQRMLFGIVRQVQLTKVSPALFTAYFFLFAVAFIIYRIVNNDSFLLPLVLPLLLYFLNSYFAKTLNLNRLLVFNLAVTALFAACFVEELHFFNAKKDAELRSIYASQLAIDQDINLELDFTSVRQKLLLDPMIKTVCNGNPENISASKMGDVLEKKHFKGLWEAYDLQFLLYDSLGKSPFGNEVQRREFWLKLKDRNGQVSAIDTTIYYIKDDVSAFNYLIFQPILLDSAKHELIIALKSKRIPEEIGFPRLLISSNAKVLSSLENYAIGKYSEGKLVRHYGEYNYPTALNALPLPRKDKGFLDFDEYNHHFYRKNASSLIILSRKNRNLFDEISAFSYVLTLWGLHLLLFPFFRDNMEKNPYRFSLAFRFQFALVMLVVLGLILFGTGSGLFIKNQFEGQTNRIIADKLRSIEEELRGKISSVKQLDSDDFTGKMESTLIRLSKVFKTDLNLYTPNGFLVATSRPKIFNQGLLSELINAQAYDELRWNNKSFYSHKESIGKLAFVSAYLPIYNGDGNLLGFVNLQHFGQQKDFEEQIQRFLVSIINVFILLLALSIVLALFVSNWLIKPLRLLGTHISSWQLGGESQKIPYDGQDEIGTLIKAYNLKLEELNEAARQLAINERESAWREMAKQVAHEIKNPLTPMKLSIQHLSRIYDPNLPIEKEKMERVLQSLVEQIDGLTKIANAFSNFARMPDPIKERVDLIALLESVITIFEAEIGVNVQRDYQMEQCILMLDKDQWLRVINNLLKNAFQSITENTIPKISVGVQKLENSIIMTITDNGAGISEEVAQQIFQPHFTTKSSGSGIGLAMVKQIVENHHGHIHFTTQIGVGSCFIVEITA